MFYCRLYDFLLIIKRFHHPLKAFLFFFVIAKIFCTSLHGALYLFYIVFYLFRYFFTVVPYFPFRAYVVTYSTTYTISHIYISRFSLH